METKNRINSSEMVEFKQTTLKIFFFYFSIFMILYMLVSSLIKAEIPNSSMIVATIAVSFSLFTNTSYGNLFELKNKMVKCQVNLISKFSFHLNELEKVTNQRSEWSFHLKNDKVYTFDTDYLSGNDVPEFVELMKSLQEQKPLSDE